MQKETDLRPQPCPPRPCTRPLCTLARGRGRQLAGPASSNYSSGDRE